MFELDTAEVRLTRRQVVAAGGAAALTAALAGLVPAVAEASPKDAKKMLAELTGGAPLNEGRIAIDVPPYTQYGKQVRIAVSVESPMGAEDRVTALHILAERNTVPEVASY
jgi:sulfur-oxidizing protein SoxY